MGGWLRMGSRKKFGLATTLQIRPPQLLSEGILPFNALIHIGLCVWRRSYDVHLLIRSFSSIFFWSHLSTLSINQSIGQSSRKIIVSSFQPRKNTDVSSPLIITKKPGPIYWSENPVFLPYFGNPAVSLIQLIPGDPWLSVPPSRRVWLYRYSSLKIFCTSFTLSNLHASLRLELWTSGKWTKFSAVAEWNCYPTLIRINLVSLRR